MGVGRIRGWLWQHDRRAFFRTRRAGHVAPPEGYRFGELSLDCFDGDPLLLRREQVFRDRIGGPHRLHGYLDETGATAAYGWLTLGPATAPLRRQVHLRIPARVAYIWDCRTADDHRGRGLYTSLVARLAQDAVVMGSSAAIICCDPNNAASRRGILAAGFDPWRTIDVYQLGPLHAVRDRRLHLQPGSIDLISLEVGF